MSTPSSAGRIDTHDVDEHAQATQPWEVGAASKAAIQQVKVLPCQLLVSDT
jgi:hypothetical protein